MNLDKENISRINTQSPLCGYAKDLFNTYMYELSYLAFAGALK